MSSSASRAPAPITPIRWLASARQTGWSAPVTPRGTAQQPALCPLALTHVAGACEGVAGTIVAAAGFSAVGSVAAGRASQVTAGGKGLGERPCCLPDKPPTPWGTSQSCCLPRGFTHRLGEPA